MPTLIQSNFEMVMTQNATLSGELDVLRESLTRLQSSANQTLADLSEKEAELRIQKRERFECESKLYAAATEQDRMKDQAHTMAGKLQQVCLTQRNFSLDHHRSFCHFFPRRSCVA
jgi:hypothetical protein